MIFGLYGRYRGVSTCCKQPLNPASSVSTKLQQKFFLVASMSNVPNITGNIMTIRPWHLTPAFSKGHSPCQKWPFKAQNQAHLPNFHFHFQCLA
jgi:hypothetical protein